jgi:spore coat protein U-like protein
MSPHRRRRWIASLAALLCALPAAAAVNCNLTVTSVNVNYDPTSPAAQTATGSYTIACSRAAGDGNTFQWRLGVNNGLYFSGSSNRVQRAAGQFYNYETYRSPGNLWGDTNTTRFTGTFNFGGALNASSSGSFDITLPGNQPELPGGAYTDTLTAELERLIFIFWLPFDTAAFNVTATTTNKCQFTSPPGDVSFNYSSFQAAPANASTAFTVRCTTALPYTMALDATSGTLLGLTYNLSLAPSTGGTGTGLPQAYSINGTIAGGQSGTCGSGVCNASQTRTLTISW